MLIGKSKLEVRLNKFLEEYEKIFEYDYNQYLNSTRIYDDLDEDTFYIIIEDEAILEQKKISRGYRLLYPIHGIFKNEYTTSNKKIQGIKD